MARITLTRLTEDDREQFILDNQWAFKYGADEVTDHLSLTIIMPPPDCLRQQGARSFPGPYL